MVDAVAKTLSFFLFPSFFFSRAFYKTPLLSFVFRVVRKPNLVNGKFVPFAVD